MRHTFNIDTGKGFSIAQSHPLGHEKGYLKANLHRLTPKQFDTLAENFGGSIKPNYLRTSSGNHFRTTDIDLGGLMVTIFADVPVEEFIPIES